MTAKAQDAGGDGRPEGRPLQKPKRGPTHTRRVWGTRKGKSRFSGFRNPVDSTGVPTPDVVVPP